MPNVPVQPQQYVAKNDSTEEKKVFEYKENAPTSDSAAQKDDFGFVPLPMPLAWDLNDI